MEVTDDIFLRKRRQSTEKEERILTATVFLSSELFYSFPVLAVKEQSLFLIISKHFLLFSLNCFLMLVLLKNGPNRRKVN